MPSSLYIQNIYILFYENKSKVTFIKMIDNRLKNEVDDDEDFLSMETEDDDVSFEVD